MRFLALSVSDAAEDVIGVIRAGARGYVTKTISGDELADAVVRVAADGDAVFSPRLAGFVLDAFRAGERVHSDAELDELTPREREVLQLIARGYRYKEIAARLHLSVKTIEPRLRSTLPSQRRISSTRTSIGSPSRYAPPAAPGERRAERCSARSSRPAGAARAGSPRTPRRSARRARSRSRR